MIEFRVREGFGRGQERSGALGGVYAEFGNWVHKVKAGFGGILGDSWKYLEFWPILAGIFRFLKIGSPERFLALDNLELNYTWVHVCPMLYSVCQIGRFGSSF